MTLKRVPVNPYPHHQPTEVYLDPARVIYGTVRYSAAYTVSARDDRPAREVPEHWSATVLLPGNVTVYSPPFPSLALAEAWLDHACTPEGHTHYYTAHPR